MKYFGEDWKSLDNLQWYKNVIDGQNNQNNEGDEQLDYNCDCIEMSEDNVDEILLMNIN